MKTFTLVPALAAFVASQSISMLTEIPSDANPTPDALDLAFLRDVAVPTYSTVEGALSQVTTYASETAVASASIAQEETPLSVFPAVTTQAINAAGEDVAPTATATPVERDVNAEVLHKRAACAPQATISNYYKVDVSTYEKFTADPIIASVASAAPTPQGYFQNFKNAKGANSAYAYMGYKVLQTGYDVATCAQACTKMNGCLAFNIYFERDPVVEPGTGCEDPNAFANIKCSFWGGALDVSTANNYGQWRSKFHVGIAGSNAYTSYSVGGPIDGWNAPLKLQNAAMNAPLRDCAGTWTYLGYKLFQDGPFDPTLCAAACDAQTKYNVANPPSSGYTPLCAAFGTYLLTMTNSTGSYVKGQMCTMYTSAWDAQYAMNTVSYDGPVKYTYGTSFFYSKAAVQPVCPSDISYLQTNGANFCSAYISYSQPTTTVSATITPSGFVTLTSTIVPTTITVDGTATGNVVWKRDDSEVSATAVLATATDYTTVESLPTNSIAILAEIQVTTPPPNRTEMVQTTTFAKRAIATPASIMDWPSYKISGACSRVATGTSTVTATYTAPSLTTTVQVTPTATAGSSCTLPTQLPSYLAWNSIFGAWDVNNGQPMPNPDSGIYGRSSTLQLPFDFCMYGTCTRVVSLGVDAYISFGDVLMSVFTELGGGLYIYPDTPHGVFYRITGDVGSRQLTFAWYTATISWGHQQSHITATYFEDKPNQIQYKYYDAIQDAPSDTTPSIYIQKGSTITRALPEGNHVVVGTQYTIKTAPDGGVTVSKTTHDRVECCTKLWWHSCTEFMPADPNS